MSSSTGAPAALPHAFTGWDASRMTAFNATFEVPKQGSNGDNVYNSTKVHMGYLDPKKHMVVSKTVWDHANGIANYAVDLKEFGKINGHLNFLGLNGAQYVKDSPFLMETSRASTGAQKMTEFWKMVVMNYIQLADNKVDPKAAAYAALFRARWALTGALAFLAKSNVEPDSEVILVESTHAVYGAIVRATSPEDAFKAANYDLAALIAVLEDQNGGIEWVLKHSENVWAAVEHTFRVKSHHFKNSGSDATVYATVYKKFLNSCYEGEFEPPEGFDWFTIAHTAIHPFKIEALPKATAHYLAHGLIADAASVRFSGAPVGNAVLTTTNAAMSTLSSEIWYDVFEQTYKAQLEELDKITRQICNDKYSYHVAAGLYGLTKIEKVTMFGKEATTSEARAKLSTLGAAASGLVQALFTARESMVDFEFSLSQAKSLNKAAANNPLMALKIRELVLKAVSGISDAETLVDAIKAALPSAVSLMSSPAAPATGTASTP